MRATIAAAAAVAIALAGSAVAEEGMWTFDNFPSAAVQSTYGFAPDQAWLDRVRAGSVRLTTGCSATIVSAEGLVQTNHHCVESCLQSLSEPGRDIVATGIRTASRSEERQCPGMRAQTLLSITDVTADIEAATAGVAGDGFARARTAAIAQIEQACRGDARDRFCEVVTLYQGGQYRLYTYKQYEDVRIAFAPERDAAAFGGDPDNFNFPRYAFDVSFLRVYENGQPASTPNRLQWRSEPLQPGELTFVSGHPGSTERLLTADQLAFQRDSFLPWRLATLSELRGRLLSYADRGPEQARVVANSIASVENSFKALSGRRAALSDRAGFARVEEAEAALRARIQRNRTLNRAVGDAYGEISAATETYRGMYLPYQYAEARAGGGSQFFNVARNLVRAGADRALPDSERMTPYTEARLPATRGSVMADYAFDPELEQILLTFWLEKMREYLTADHPLVRQVLGRESPQALARRLVTSTTLADPAVREALWEGGADAVAASTDPMIVFVREWDAAARALRTQYEQDVEGPIARAQERLARARFQLTGDNTYPDATFTLRLSYGIVQGWTEAGGRDVPPFTYTSGMWARATGAAPFVPGAAWSAARDRLDPNTIFNISTTHDIIGGNSGSPLLDRDGRVAGAVFDGNIHSLGGAYFYDGRLNRTVTVASTIIQEALVDVYGQQALMDEILR